MNAMPIATTNTPENENRDKVNTPSVAYEQMAKHWDLIHDLLGGTLTMREASTKWLLKEQAEKDANYKSRLQRTILFEALKDTIDSIVSKPFSKPITLKNVPENLAYLERNADRCGTTISQVGMDALDDCATYGLTHLLVDWSILRKNETSERKATIAEEKKAGVRSTFTVVSPPNLIGWSSDDDENGNPYLTEIRIREYRKERVEGKMYLDHIVEYIRVVRPDAWELHRQDQKTREFSLVASGINTLGKVPLVTVYVRKTGFMTASPPLEGLAWLNLAHYQSDSDQRNILRVSRFAILFGKGLGKKEAESGFEIGPFNTLTSSSNDAELKFVEHQGKAIAAGRQDIQDLEARMETMGKAPMVDRSVRSTATGKSIDHNKNMTAIQKWVKALEIGLEEAYELAAEWHKITLPEDFAVDIYSDFSVTVGGAKSLELLLKMAEKGKLSTETLLNEAQRRGELADEIDPEEELERIEAEGQRLGLITGGPDDELPPEDEDEDDDEGEDVDVNPVPPEDDD